LTKTRIKKWRPRQGKDNGKNRNSEFVIWSETRISRSEVETQIRKLITEKFEEKKHRNEETKRKIVNHKGRLR